MARIPQDYQEAQVVQNRVFEFLVEEVKEANAHRQRVVGESMGSLIWHSRSEDLFLTNPFRFRNKKELRRAIVEFMKTFYDLLRDHESHFEYMFTIFLTPEYSLESGELRNYYFQSFVLNDEEAGDMFQRFSRTKHYVSRDKFMREIERYLLSQFSRPRVLPLVFRAELYRKKYPGGSSGRGRGEPEGSFGRFQPA